MPQNTLASYVFYQSTIGDYCPKATTYKLLLTAFVFCSTFGVVNLSKKMNRGDFYESNQPPTPKKGFDWVAFLFIGFIVLAIILLITH